MQNTFFVAELKQYGITLTALEAVAIVQQLIHGNGIGRAEPPYGPPTPENVELRLDGSVVCRASEAKPAVAELAILLQALVPLGTASFPGGLQYAIARALHEVDAPPFDSVESFSAALARYERSDRAATVRKICERVLAPRVAPARIVWMTTGQSDRRRVPAAVTELRRELRFVHERFYEQQATAKRVIEMPREQRPRRRIAAAAAGLAAGLLLCSALEMLPTSTGAAPEAAMPRADAPSPRAEPSYVDTSAGMTMATYTPVSTVGTTTGKSACGHASTQVRQRLRAEASASGGGAPRESNVSRLPRRAPGTTSGTKSVRLVSARGSGASLAPATDRAATDRRQIARGRARSSDAPRALARIRFEWGVL